MAERSRVKLTDGTELELGELAAGHLEDHNDAFNAFLETRGQPFDKRQLAAALELVWASAAAAGAGTGAATGPATLEEFRLRVLLPEVYRAANEVLRISGFAARPEGEVPAGEAVRP